MIARHDAMKLLGAGIASTALPGSGAATPVWSGLIDDAKRVRN
jgi:hypothetical protein